MTKRQTPAERIESELWRTAPDWWDRRRDNRAVGIVASLLAERDVLVSRVEADPEDWRSRIALRQVDTQCERLLDRLGLTPHGRHRLGLDVQVARPQGRLAELRAVRDAAAN
jgi:hypothetical protein